MKNHEGQMSRDHMVASIQKFYELMCRHEEKMVEEEAKEKRIRNISLLQDMIQDYQNLFEEIVIR